MLKRNTVFNLNTDFKIFQKFAGFVMKNVGSFYVTLETLSPASSRQIFHFCIFSIEWLGKLEGTACYTYSIYILYITSYICMNFQLN